MKDKYKLRRPKEDDDIRGMWNFFVLLLGYMATIGVIVMIVLAVIKLITR